MSERFYKHRYLIARRTLQALILLLLIAANTWGWHILQGNLSLTKLLQTVPLADPYAVLQMFCAGNIAAADALIGAALVLAFYSLLAGRAFCAWVCPINPVTDLANWLRRKMRWPHTNPGTGPERGFRYWILGLSLVLSLLLGVAAFEMISPVAMVHRGLVFGVGMGWVVVLAVFLYDLLIQGNGFCGHLCPLGAFYTLVTRLCLIRVDHDHEACTECQDCRVVCPESHILQLVGRYSGMVLAGECTNCGRGVEVCEDDALVFGFRKYNKPQDAGG
jgi:ferredoxin-type protein NapH